MLDLGLSGLIKVYFCSVLDNILVVIVYSQKSASSFTVLEVNLQETIQSQYLINLF